MALQIILNGQLRVFEALADGASILDLVADLQLKADRVAIERNGEITPRSTWSQSKLSAHDCIELVHFVGGGINI